MLRQVAESARAVRQPDVRMDVDVSRAPNEIRDVVDALQQLLENIRTETEKNRVFTASLAHELRSPIQNLMGETEVALITQRDAPAYRRVLQSHMEELRDLADAVDNLVTICSARPTRVDGQHETRESFDLAEESQMRLARERGYAKSRGVNVEISSAGDTRLYGDREGLLRALRNLTANAIEWSNQGSSVTVHLEGENGDLVITVDDAGPGVPEELREKIFDPFFRGPAANGRRVGYGLGLAIVRSAVTDHGGQIEIGTSPLGGARFRMILPRGRGDPSSPDAEMESRDAGHSLSERSTADLADEAAVHGRGPGPV
jgi:two-component system heavy metal sensor histidine kinase CusS